MIRKVLIAALLVLPLAACEGGVKEAVGLTKSAPDEFAVVKRAPLAMPPDYNLRPPQPGAARPQEQSPDAQAKEAVFGAQSVDAEPKSEGEAALLKAAGSEIANPSIRGQVDSEAGENAKDNRPVVKKIMGGLSSDELPPATVVDAKAEAERLRKNKEEGKPATAGSTPTIDE